MVARRLKHEWGPLAYKFMPVQNGMGAPALDFFWCICGLFVAIETKTKGKKPTGRQEDTLGQISTAHGLTFVVDDGISLMEAVDAIHTEVLRCHM